MYINNHDLSITFVIEVTIIHIYIDKHIYIYEVTMRVEKTTGQGHPHGLQAVRLCCKA